MLVSLQNVMFNQITLLSLFLLVSLIIITVTNLDESMGPTTTTN